MAMYLLMDRGDNHMDLNMNGSTDGELCELTKLFNGGESVGADERRNRERFYISCSMHLTPLDRNGQLLQHETIVIVGRDMSSTGISFSHECPISHRRAVVTLNNPKVGRLSVEVEILWTRPTPLGLYESGCRLVKKATGHMLCVS